MAKTQKQTPFTRLHTAFENLQTSIAEVKDWNDIANTAKEDRVKNKAKSAAARYSADVEYLEQKIRYLVFKHASVEQIMKHAVDLVPNKVS